jgi:hypothetical protein
VLFSSSPLERVLDKRNIPRLRVANRLMTLHGPDLFVPLNKILAFIAYMSCPLGWP